MAEVGLIRFAQVAREVAETVQRFYGEVSYSPLYLRPR